ncbi:transketolase family protein [Treponema phagedenis]|uniref:Putative transketolase C-terminal section n=1 Tax=Treponema phagedenis TaxID=162 RepID=A0A0B7GS61_TREPH|nr:transketolase C-terminal domain-containing protein [Treponema phagedenis]QEK01840.1 transketolase family protein [Treponema phagedenis]QEK06954.1 transketolase family protein [Treponema phagedenis]QSI00038.1 transketolase family protein [Treponema phagedenis]CEM61444.1 putative transketolase C-terminal section [Treponema phagedenis]
MTTLKAPRDAFGEALIELHDLYPNLFVLCADLATAVKTKQFAETFPDRFLNVGICEQNMMSFAAGLASENFIVIASTFSVFAAGRAFDQVRQSIAFDSYNVKIMATHQGLSVGADGAIHQCMEDIALMRAIPNMKILAPSDEMNTKGAVKTAVATDGAFYVRIGRAEMPKLYDDSFKFEIGKSYVLREGKDITLAGTGIMVYHALLAAEELRKEGVTAEVIDCSSIKPFDEKTLIQSVQKTGCVLSLEDHSMYGGLGSCIAEILAQKNPAPLKIMAIKDLFGQSGSKEELLAAYGLDKTSIVSAAKDLIKTKK